MYEMKPEYYTGIEMIDREHTQLFAYAGEMYDLLHEDWKYDKYDEIQAVLIKLRDYTKEHFRDEEEYMESIHYKKIFTQKTQHFAFVEMLEKYDLNDLEENQDAVITEILTFVTEWLIHHILEVDMDLKTTV